jgi:hypothetical protein
LSDSGCGILTIGAQLHRFFVDVVASIAPVATIASIEKLAALAATYNTAVQQTPTAAATTVTTTGVRLRVGHFGP